jgi:hypothetical protein
MAGQMKILYGKSWGKKESAELKYTVVLNFCQLGVSRDIQGADRVSSWWPALCIIT